ncbi:MAG: N-acetylmuramoyl-L-alanine amidase, partial [Pseudomonadota bacterium]
RPPRRAEAKAWSAASILLSLRLEALFGERPMQRAILFLFVAFWALAAVVAQAQGFRALARVDPATTQAQNRPGGVEITLGLSQSVPYRLRIFSGPPRLAIDFREVAWSGFPPDFNQAEGIERVSTGAAADAPGWSRIVLELGGPFAITSAQMQTNPETGAASVQVILSDSDAAAFAAIAEATEAPAIAPLPGGAEDVLVIALDPGHGGVDPGAEADGLREADLMLTFARELAEMLLRTGSAEVVLTRNSDAFVSLAQRISIARAAGADAFVSLHADALADGSATGATVYTLSDSASDAAAAALAERFDRADMLTGVDLAAADDAVAGILMDLTRHETGARADALADGIVEAFAAAGIALHPNPRHQAGFTVLKAADIPSVLVEVGFLSEEEDRARIVDPIWRAEMQAAFVSAILNWAEADLLQSGLRLQ